MKLSCEKRGVLQSSKKFVLVQRERKRYFKDCQDRMVVATSDRAVEQLAIFQEIWYNT